MNCIRLDDGTLAPAIPEPFWYGGGLFSLFQSHPACYQCCNPKTGKTPMHLKNRAEWEEHYLAHHLAEDEPELYMLWKNN